MNIFAALKQEEAKLRKQADKVRPQLDALRGPMQILGGMGDSAKPIVKKKRVMSAAARAKIGKATKARWAKIRAAKAKGKH